MLLAEELAHERDRHGVAVGGWRSLRALKTRR
jgi:hypothetical protein